jgi:adenosylmethionine-8-amino-7-oxononanoate aminotransferase
MTTSSGTADHLWLHFSRLDAAGDDLLVMERGEGAYVFDTRGNRYLDALSGLFVVQVGHGRRELAEAAARQAETLAFFPLWGYGHPAAIGLADKIVSLAPEGIERVFFTSGGSEAVESAWKIVRSHFLLTGQPQRHKVIARRTAYHGTTLGALSITGVDALREPFLPMLNGATAHAQNTDHPHGGPGECGLDCAEDIERCILAEGPETVAAVFLEPVQNAGGCLPPPPGYFDRVREICDRHGVLLVSDEVICGFGRLGAWFGSGRLDYRPDLITFAKGVTSGYAPLGGVLVADHVVEPFRDAPAFLHGLTFAGHPVSCAVGLANLEVMEREDLPGRALAHEPDLRAALETLLDLPIVREVRGVGYFFGVALGDDGGPLSPEAVAFVIPFLRGRTMELGLHCRVDDRAQPVLMLSPPLITGPEEFDEIRRVLRTALEEAWTQLPH